MADFRQLRFAGTRGGAVARALVLARYGGASGGPATRRYIGPAEVSGEAGTGNPRPGSSVYPEPAGDPRRTSIWPHVEAQVLDAIERHRSTIVFANSRRLAERLCARLNELAAERAAERVEIAARDGYPETALESELEAPPVVARAHHGSVSRAERTQIEEALKAGRLPAMAAAMTRRSSSAARAAASGKSIVDADACT